MSSPVPPTSNLPSEGTATADVPTSSVATVTSQNYLSSQSSQPVEAEAIAQTFASSDALMLTGRSSTRMSAHLTEEQSELVQGLMRHHVALPTVVGVIEGMLRAGQSDSTGASEVDRPPEYEFV